MEEVLERYSQLLAEIDSWLDSCFQNYAGQISCRMGCSECCRGLFDITLLDALLLKQGIDRLPEWQRASIMAEAERRVQGISAQWRQYTRPWMLNNIPEQTWDDMMPEDDETPCLLLSESGSCLVYPYRPMTCRLNGIPMIDVSGEELFDEWCNLNFTDCDPRELEGVRFRFKDVFAQELLLFRELTRRLCGVAISEIDTLIPVAPLLDEKLLADISADPSLLNRP